MPFRWLQEARKEEAMQEETGEEEAGEEEAGGSQAASPDRKATQPDELAAASPSYSVSLGEEAMEEGVREKADSCTTCTHLD